MWGRRRVTVVFSKPVSAATAQDASHYVFTNGVAVTGAALAADMVTVTLNTGTLVFGSNYSIIINGILDRASTPVMIAADTAAEFFGVAVCAGGHRKRERAGDGDDAVPTGLAVGGGGATLGGSRDQGNFQYQQVTGNFDVRVCVAGLSLSSIWAEAGFDGAAIA